jgi:GLPGLI family protein
MKKIQITLSLVFILFASLLNAQKFEGKITFKTEFPELPAEMESMKAMMEMNMTTYVKGNLSRTETKGMMTPNVVNIMDLDKKVMTTLMDLEGNKTAIVTNIEDQEKAMNANGMSKPTFRETGETRKISGFTCNQVIATMSTPETGEMNIEIWYTKEIANNSPEYMELQGMPLETIIPIQPGMVMKMTATEVKAEKVDASLFEIPSDYKVTTQEEMRSGKTPGK